MVFGIPKKKFNDLNDKVSTLESTVTNYKNAADSEIGKLRGDVSNRANNLDTKRREYETKNDQRIDALEQRVDERARQTEGRVQNMIAGYSDFVKSVLNSAMPNKPVELDPKAAHIFLTQTQDQGYEVFKAAVLAAAAKFGAEGKLTGFGKSFDEQGRERMGLLRSRTTAYAGGITLDVTVEIPTSASSDGSVAGYIGRMSALSEGKRVYNQVAFKANAGHSTEVVISVGSSDTDTWTKRIMQEPEGIVKNIAYGAFEKLLAADNLYAAGNVYNNHLQGMTDVLVEAVAAKPQLVRYVGTSIEALGKQVKE